MEKFETPTEILYEILQNKARDVKQNICYDLELQLIKDTETLQSLQNLVSEGADLFVIEQRGTPCIPLVFWNVELIQFFLDHRRDPNAQDESGNTALIYAASYGLGEAVQFLLDHSADPSVRNFNGETALYKVITEHSNYSRNPSDAMSVAKTLIEYGAEVNVGTATEGLTFLHHPGFNPEVFEFLLDVFENIDIRTSKSHYENTPLMEAARRGDVELCRLLVARNADVRAKNSQGYSPIHYAIYSGNWDCVRFLLSCGSDLNIKSGLTGSFDTIGYLSLFEVDSTGIVDLFEDPIKRIDFYEMVGAIRILQDLFEQGHVLWEKAHEIRTELNIPKATPSQKQKTTYKIQDEVRTKREMVELFEGDNDSIYCQALVTIDRISNGSVWITLGVLSNLLDWRLLDQFKRGLVSDMFQHLEETMNPIECSEDEFNGETIGRFVNYFNDELYRSQMVSFVETCLPFISKICIAVLKKRTFDLNMAFDLCRALVSTKYYSNVQSVLQLHKDLIKEIVNLDSRDVNGNTMLHFACEFAHYEIAKVLIDCGADVTAKNKLGQEPIQLIHRKLSGRWSYKPIDLDLVLKMVESGAHFDAKTPFLNSETAFGVIESSGTNMVPYLSLKCLAARVLAHSCIHYKGVLPDKMTVFVNRH